MRNCLELGTRNPEFQSRSAFVIPHMIWWA